MQEAGEEEETKNGVVVVVVVAIKHTEEFEKGRSDPLCGIGRPPKTDKAV